MADLESLKRDIEALPVPDRLRLAAGLLERRQVKIAHSIIERIALELGAALALAREAPRG